mmetsp:Transcript_29084/g.76765  ORF Transcript_29084/g.76765 Transcript_29084/m.76765 type:complete len:106 (+) Transcript_29084:285-602(+)
MRRQSLAQKREIPLKWYLRTKTCSEGMQKKNWASSAKDSGDLNAPVSKNTPDGSKVFRAASVATDRQSCACGLDRNGGAPHCRNVFCGSARLPDASTSGLQSVSR